MLTRAEERVSSRDGERDLYQYLSSVQGLGGFQDHFEWWPQCRSSPASPRRSAFSSALFLFFRWASNTFSIRGGKPFWVDPFDQNVQHIFIDDNIRQNDEDTIVHPKVGPFMAEDESQAKKKVLPPCTWARYFNL